MSEGAAVSRQSKDGGRVGETLAGRYRLVRRIGSGGMGDVYEARDEATDRNVAVKILRDENAEDSISLARFFREFRAVARVNHPNVVKVYDAGSDAKGLPYIVQELLVGIDLAAYLEERGGRLPVEHALELMRPVIDAIGAAHKMGVVHRDLKPENVFLVPDGDAMLPKVLDFGISKILADDGTDESTRTGVIVGTLHYMSPERIMGTKTIDAHADVWALGVMLHELIAGDLPWDQPGGKGLFVRICLEDAKPLDATVPGAAGDLTRIILRCLRREPADRYPTAAELARDLRYVRERKPIEATQRLMAIRIDQPATVDPKMLPPTPSLRAPAPTLEAPIDWGTAGSHVAAPIAPALETRPRATPPVAIDPKRDSHAARTRWWTFALAAALAVLTIVLGR